MLLQPSHNLTSISIHALREESDVFRSVSVRIFSFYFNPRSPRGERRVISDTLGRLTPRISIHALREESDIRNEGLHIKDTNFNPRSPRGERLFSVGIKYATDAISIHALREESDRHKRR